MLEDVKNKVVNRYSVEVILETFRILGNLFRSCEWRKLAAEILVHSAVRTNCAEFIELHLLRN